MPDVYTIPPESSGVYPGPRPFNISEAAIFHGREREIEDIKNLILSYRSVLLYGQSGTGKSSLVLAGVLARWGVSDYLIARVSGQKRPGLSSNIYSYNVLLSAQQGVDPQRATLSRALVRRGRPWLLILDQFEELFTAYPQYWRERYDFFHELRRLLKVDRSVHLVFIIREEHVAELDRFASFLPDGFRIRYHLERLREDAAHRAIVQPAKCMGSPQFAALMERLAPDLVAKLQRLRQSVNGVDEIVDSEFIEPVHLQVVCRDIADRFAANGNNVPHLELTQTVDVDATLAGFFNSALRRVAGRNIWRQWQIRSWFDSTLITPAGTRDIAYMDHEHGKTRGIPNALVTALSAEHIIRLERRGGSDFYELTHDRFIPPIQRSNSEWKRRMRQFALLALAVPLTVASGWFIHREYSRDEMELKKQINVTKSQLDARDNQLAATSIELALAQLRLNDGQGLDRTIVRMTAVDGLKALSDLDSSITSASGDRRAQNELRNLRLRFLSYINSTANSDKVKDSPELLRYVCSHDWGVIVSSVPVLGSTLARNELLQRFRTHYPNATYHASRRNPDYQALVADYFLTADEAQSVVRDISELYPGVAPWVDRNNRDCPTK